jgi:hypothetical protein
MHSVLLIMGVVAIIIVYFAVVLLIGRFGF